MKGGILFSSTDDPDTRFMDSHLIASNIIGDDDRIVGGY